MAIESGRFRRLSEKFKITSTLAGIGALSGAVAALVLTFLGNVISGYPIKPGASVYAWNVGVFAILGAVLGPPLVWSMLRRVPLWRTLTEPALAGVIGSVVAMVTAPALFAVIVPAAILGSAWRLQHVYRERDRAPRLPSTRD
jgi:hypothetical protein